MWQDRSRSCEKYLSRNIYLRFHRSFRARCCSEVTAIQPENAMSLSRPWGLYKSKREKRMKKVLLVTASLIALGAAAPALAADLAARPYTKAPAMIAAVYDWSGFYIGV